MGPDAALIELARWASVRWAAGRLRPFLVAASPPANVGALPPERRTKVAVEPAHRDAADLLVAGGGMLRLPPTEDVLPVLAAAARLGPLLVIVPSVDRARIDATRLRRAGLAVALVPQEWAQAAAGVDVVIGARAAAWAPCRDLAASSSSTSRRSRCRRSAARRGTPATSLSNGVAAQVRRSLLVSPCPTVSGLAAVGDRLRRPAIDDERSAWPIVEVVDRGREEPWKRSLVTPALIAHLRNNERTVVCVQNTLGRARILACRACRTLARCERCEAAVGLTDEGLLACRRCGLERPAVCRACGATSFANLRPGVTRLREELEAAAGRPVIAVTGDATDPPAAAGVYVGTEAVLHRLRAADVVAFLDLDAELLAPRYRAAEQAMALLVRAARLTGSRLRGGRLLLQTFLPRHEVVQAALLADPGRLTGPETERRRLLSLPPFAALAAVSGPGPRLRRRVAAQRRRRLGRRRVGTSGRRRPRACGDVGRARPGADRSAAPEGQPRPRRGRSAAPLAHGGRADLQHAVATRGGEACGRPALVDEPALQRVGTEVLLDDEHRPALGRESPEPRRQQGVQCRLADADRRVRPDEVEPYVGGTPSGSATATLGNSLAAAFAAVN